VDTYTRRNGDGRQRRRDERRRVAPAGQFHGPAVLCYMRSVDLVEASGAATRRHPWEEARYRFFERILDEAGLLRAPTALLDAGAGDGWFTHQLCAEHPALEAVCWDAGYPQDPPPRGRCRFTRRQPDRSFDVVLLLDVLEHVERDGAFLSSVVQTNVRPGGHLLFSVPAWQALFSSHDVRLRHVRRYSPRRARELLASAGLELVRGGGLFHSLLPVRALAKVAERLGLASGQAHAGEWNASAATSSIVAAALACDTRVSLMASAVAWDLPGLSWWAVCRKPSS
jgi:SAM-dependent methyltransferase